MFFCVDLFIKGKVCWRNYVTLLFDFDYIYAIQFIPREYKSFESDYES